MMANVTGSSRKPETPNVRVTLCACFMFLARHEKGHPQHYEAAKEGQ